MDAKQLKLVSAGVGVGAVVAMGALGVAFGTDVSSAQPEPPPPGPVTTSEITTGQTAPPRVAPTEDDAPTDEQATEEQAPAEDDEGDDAGANNGSRTTTPSVARPVVTAEPPDGFGFD